MTNLWLDSPRRGEKKTQINKIRNEKGEISTDTTGIQKERDDCEQLHAKKFDNLEEMDNFLETYSLPKLNQEEIYQPNRPITRNEIVYIIKSTGVPVVAQWLTNPTRDHEVAGLIPALAQWVKDLPFS